VKPENAVVAAAEADGVAIATVALQERRRLLPLKQERLRLMQSQSQSLPKHPARHQLRRATLSDPAV
jgi:hypothetical protein